MPKLNKVYTDQLNFLAPGGTMDALVAIAFYRGDKGRYAGPARDFISKGIREFIEALPEKERRRFDDILRNVQITTHNRGG
jgi:hypothetical protein